MTYASRYRDQVEQAIGFAGVDHDFFVEAKARELLRIVGEHLGDPSRHRAVDVGCGAGLTDRFLTDRFARLDGVDVVPEAIASAAKLNPSAHYQLVEDGTLPLADDSVDVAFAVCVLQVVPPGERPKLVGEMRRVVRPAGLLVAFEHNPLNPLTRIAAARWRSDQPASLLSRRALARLLAEAGTILTTRYVVFFPWRSERLRAVEARLGRVPLGAQHVVAARVT